MVVGKEEEGARREQEKTCIEVSYFSIRIWEVDPV
jgi:hypothetical protein